MSSVAEALRRAQLGAERKAIDPHDHPWARELSPTAIDKTVESTDEPSTTINELAALETPHPVLTGAEPAVVRGFSGSRGAQVSPLGRLDPRARRQLAALVDRVFLPVSDPLRSCALARVGSAVSSAPITAALADLLSEQTAGRVCAIDANFAGPSLHEQFGVAGGGRDGAAGSPASLVRGARAVRPNLWVLPRGDAHLRPALSSETSRMQFARLIASFDYVLMDLEPLDVASPAIPLMRLLDGVVLVIDAEVTRRHIARQAVDVLRSTGVEILGAILANRRYPVPAAIYRRL
jgi:protein-tyrosine kinase